MPAVPVCEVREVPLGEGREFCVNGRTIAVWNIEGTCYATQAECPHAHGPLTAGAVHGRVVICPLHAWMFDVTTGRAVNPLGAPPLETFPVEVRDGRVLLLQPDGGEYPRSPLAGS